MVPFAGYHMSLVYGDVGQGLYYPSTSRLEVADSTSLVASRQHVRQIAGLFDTAYGTSLSTWLNRMSLSSLNEEFLVAFAGAAIADTDELANARSVHVPLPVEEVESRSCCKQTKGSA